MRSPMILLIPAVISMLAGSAVGQDPGGKVSVSYSLTPTPHVTVTNNYSSRLTGMVITVSSTVAPYRRTEIIWFDSGINFRRDPPLESGASRSFPVGPTKQAPTLEPKLAAVAFEDETSAGDQQWLSELHARRQAASDEIKTVTELLNQAFAQGQPNDQIISSLDGLKASLRTSIPEIEARIAAELVIGTAVSNLERASVGGAVGDPQKTIPAVILPLFAEWRGDLKRYDRKIN